MAGLKWVYEINSSGQRFMHIKDSSNATIATVRIHITYYRYTHGGKTKHIISNGLYGFFNNQYQSQGYTNHYGAVYRIHFIEESAVQYGVVENSPASDPVTYLTENKVSEFFPTATDITTIGWDTFIQEVAENLFSFHSDPVYVEATKLKYTDGTYNFARGNNTSDQARKKAYNHLLKTYGTFYKGTEEELASSFATELTNGGGVIKPTLTKEQEDIIISHYPNQYIKYTERMVA